MEHSGVAQYRDCVSTIPSVLVVCGALCACVEMCGVVYCVCVCVCVCVCHVYM